MLELHRLKEEMRLFPMIISGGDARLLPHLVQDMMQEHERLDHQASALSMPDARTQNCSRP